MHSAEKAGDTTLNDEKYDMCYSQWCPIGKNMTGTYHSNFVMVLCNQPEAFALDLGDDQSHCLYIM